MPLKGMIHSSEILNYPQNNFNIHKLRKWKCFIRNEWNISIHKHTHAWHKQTSKKKICYFFLLRTVILETPIKMYIILTKRKCDWAYTNDYGTSRKKINKKKYTSGLFRRIPKIMTTIMDGGVASRKTNKHINKRTQAWADKVWEKCHRKHEKHKHDNKSYVWIAFKRNPFKHWLGLALFWDDFNKPFITSERERVRA